MVLSTKPDSLSVSVWMLTLRSEGGKVEFGLRSARVFFCPLLLVRATYLDIVLVSNLKALIDVARRRPPVLVKLESARSRLDDVDESVGSRIVALPGEGEVQRKAVGRRPEGRREDEIRSNLRS